jgi:hypothetical protein
MWSLGHLRVQPHSNPVEAMRRIEHLWSQSSKILLKSMYRTRHLRSQPQPLRNSCKQYGGSLSLSLSHSLTHTHKTHTHTYTHRSSTSTTVFQTSAINSVGQSSPDTTSLLCGWPQEALMFWATGMLLLAFQPRMRISSQSLLDAQGLRTC